MNLRQQRSRMLRRIARGWIRNARPACPQTAGVTCLWPDCLSIGCPVAKAASAQTTETKSDGE
jgi:hypothetical protein